MIFMEETKIYSKEEFDTGIVLLTIKKVMEILDERGYNSTNQIVGYLMSGDPGYITSYKDARKMITEVDRSKLLEALIKQI